MNPFPILRRSRYIRSNTRTQRNWLPRSEICFRRPLGKVVEAISVLAEGASAGSGAAVVGILPAVAYPAGALVAVSAVLVVATLGAAAAVVPAPAAPQPTL